RGLGRAHRRAPRGPVGRRAHRAGGPGRPPAARRPPRRPSRRAADAPRLGQARRMTTWTTRPRVWAPAARTVDLHLPSGVPGADPGLQVHAMRPAGGGWWRSPVDLPAGTDYAFAVDDGEPRPDPRSPWQPHGVHGPSRTFDSAAHAW